MTSVQLKMPQAIGLSAGVVLVFAWLMLASAGGCQRGREPRLDEPSRLVLHAESPKVWAVVPPLNEAGVSAVDVYRVADMFTKEVEQIDGVATLPVNRVIAAKRELEIEAVTTIGEARTLMRVLDADGLIVGTVTAYNPYDPPVLGMAVQLFTDDTRTAGEMLDAHELVRSPTDDGVGITEMAETAPIAQASGVFDASNHQTLAWLREYAEGRTTPDSAYGRRIYLVRMELYTQFVSYRLLRDLLNAEHARRQPAIEPAS